MPPKRQAVTLETKKALLDYKEKNPSVTHEQLKDKFGLANRKTVTDILSKKEKYMAAAINAEAGQADTQRKKLRKCEFPEVSALLSLLPIL